jgi:hypothetical protein
VLINYQTLVSLFGTVFWDFECFLERVLKQVSSDALAHCSPATRQDSALTKARRAEAERKKEPGGNYIFFYVVWEIFLLKALKYLYVFFLFLFLFCSAGI